MDEPFDNDGRKRTTSEKIWDSTRKTLHMATFQAGKYKRIVQKKIDLAALHRKIDASHNDLGRLIDELREQQIADLLAAEEVQALFVRLDGLKQAAAEIEAEIEDIKEETEERPPEPGEQ